MKKLLILFLFSTISHCLFAQEKVYMPFFEVLNMHPDYQYSSSKLFKSYLSEQNIYNLILPEKCDTLYKESAVKAAENAKKLGANFYAIGEINVVGQNLMVLSLSLYKTADATKIWSDIVKAKGLADLDPVMQKLAMAMSSNTKSKEEGDIYTVSNYESKVLPKVNASYYWGLKVGGAYPFLKYITKPSAGLGAVFSYDSRNWIVDVTGEMYFGDAGIYDFNVAMTYPFSAKMHGPFASGGLGFGSISYTEKQTDFYGNAYSDKRNNGGLMLFAGGGYLINRTSNVNVRIGGQAFVSGFKAQGVIPVGILFNITVLFEK